MEEKRKGETASQRKMEIYFYCCFEIYEKSESFVMPSCRCTSKHSSFKKPLLHCLQYVERVERFFLNTLLQDALFMENDSMKNFIMQNYIKIKTDSLNFNDYVKTCLHFKSLKLKIIKPEPSERQKISLTRCFHLMDTPNWSHFLYLFGTDLFVVSITLCHFMSAWSFDCFRFNTATVITSKKFSVVMKAFLCF